MKKKPAKKKASTALARRKPSAPAKRQTRALLPALKVETAIAPRNLTDEIALGELGLVEVKLTEKEEQVLSRPIDLADMRVKPTGQVYLSHPTYTKWFNDAFGRTGWALVPCARPVMSERSVVCPYILYIHKQPAAFAMGEQEYHASNKEQTYGDAIEATVASALRRCAKRLGVGIEMWDRTFGNAFLAQYAVKVWCDVKGENKPQWRLRTDPPFWNETPSAQRGSTSSGGRRQEQTQTPRREAPAGTNSKAEEPITNEQKIRFWTIARRAGRSDDEVKEFLKTFLKVDSSSKIKRKDYEATCAAAEYPGPMRLNVEPPMDREIGEEG